MNLTATDIVTIIGVFGGINGLLELVKWRAQKKAYIKTEDSNARAADARADQEEFKALRDYNNFLQEQLTKKEERFVEQTERLRDTQTKLDETNKKIAQLELELYQKRCETKKCPNREPQNGY